MRSLQKTYRKRASVFRDKKHKRSLTTHQFCKSQHREGPALLQEPPKKEPGISQLNTQLSPLKRRSQCPVPLLINLFPGDC